MRDLSSLSIKRTECPRCGARWLNGQLYWATGCKAKEQDLAGLVCNVVDSDECINPEKGSKGGDTWDKRARYIENLERVADQRMKLEWDAGIFGMD